MALRINSAEFIVGAVGTADRPSDSQPEVAFAGRSNVGKSSLINRLVRRKALARTSSTPGKTQQLNYYHINGSFYLVDLPGYGYVHGGVNLRQRLGKMTEAYLTTREGLRAVVQLVDARHGPTELDQVMIDWLRASAKPFLLVFTKSDKLSKGKLEKQVELLESEGTLTGLLYTTFSAVTDSGREEIWDWIAEQVQ
jgi:GTP-binding protein